MTSIINIDIPKIGFSFVSSENGQRTELVYALIQGLSFQQIGFSMSQEFYIRVSSVQVDNQFDNSVMFYSENSLSKQNGVEQKMIPSYFLFRAKIWNQQLLQIEGLEYKFGQSVIVLKDGVLIRCVDLYRDIMKTANSYFTYISELFAP